MSFDLELLRVLVSRHHRVARILVVGTKGSVPRAAGTSMHVWEGGQIGTIGGGRLEHDAVTQALRGTRVDHVALGPGVGQCCGGAVTLVTEVFDAQSLPAPHDPYHLRHVTGTARTPLAIQRGMLAMRNAKFATPLVFSDGWLLEPLQPPARDLWIFGAGHVGRALVQVLAPLPDFRITWVDTSPDRFPEDVADGVTLLPAKNPADVVRFAPGGAEHLILTYSHALDLEICHRLLLHEFAQAGLIGSKTKWARFRSRLRNLGHTDAQISRIHCPIGQPELGKHPQAIAVGVAATLLLQAGMRESVKDKAG